SFGRWVSVVAYRPAPMQFASIVEDITSRRAAQEEIESQHERLRVTLHSIGDAVITTDDAGRVRYLNPEAERLTARSDADAAGAGPRAGGGLGHERRRGGRAVAASRGALPARGAAGRAGARAGGAGRARARRGAAGHPHQPPWRRGRDRADGRADLRLRRPR